MYEKTVVKWWSTITPIST